jgi:hypothetical protein
MPSPPESLNREIVNALRPLVEELQKSVTPVPADQIPDLCRRILKILTNIDGTPQNLNCAFWIQPPAPNGRQPSFYYRPDNSVLAINLHPQSGLQKWENALSTVLTGIAWHKVTETHPFRVPTSTAVSVPPPSHASLQVETILNDLNIKNASLPDGRIGLLYDFAVDLLSGMPVADLEKIPEKLTVDLIRIASAGRPLWIDGPNGPHLADKKVYRAQGLQALIQAQTVLPNILKPAEKWLSHRFLFLANQIRQDPEIRAISQENWPQLSDDAKIKILKKISTLFDESFGIRPSEIQGVHLPIKRNGAVDSGSRGVCHFNHETQTSQIKFNLNPRFINDFEKSKAYIIHEKVHDLLFQATWKNPALPADHPLFQAAAFIQNHRNLNSTTLDLYRGQTAQQLYLTDDPQGLIPVEKKAQWMHTAYLGIPEEKAVHFAVDIFTEAATHLANRAGKITIPQPEPLFAGPSRPHDPAARPSLPSHHS